jgi:hypothetical protein
MNIGRTEALDIFSKWFQERSEIRLQGSFPKFAFGLWGRILRVSQKEIVLISDDNKAETSVYLAPELEFGYADNRQVTGEEKKFSECIVIFFDTKTEPFDTISLAALEGN